MEIFASYLLEIIFSVLVGVIFWFFKSKLKIDLSPEMDEFIRDAINYGKKVATKELGEEVNKIDFDNKVIEETVALVSSKAPKWMKQLGIDADFVRTKVISLLD